MAGRMLRLKEVCPGVGLSRSTIWLKIQQGTFPRPVRLGAHNVRWVESEIEAWKAARIEERDGPEWATKPGKGRKGGSHEQEQHAA
jgi:prophage regulatory protein